ncbi:MAG: hypothetical protein STHCBS139747_005750 [Sporothrix thermara]
MLVVVRLIQGVGVGQCITITPIYLSEKDRANQAWAITERLHHDPRDASQIQTKEEFYQMRAQIEHDRTQSLSLWYMFRKPSLRRRILLSCGVLFGGQACGPLNLGMSGSMPLLMYAVYVAVGAAVNILAALVMDRVGRRPLLCIDFFCTTVTMSIEIALVARYGLCIDNTAFVYCAEVYPTLYRAKGMAMGLFTARLSLEEINQLFGDTVVFQSYDGDRRGEGSH